MPLILPFLFFSLYHAAEKNKKKAILLQQNCERRAMEERPEALYNRAKRCYDNATNNQLFMKGGLTK